MNCYTHYDRQATDRCEHCGQYICGECKVNVGEHVYCKSCAAAFAGGAYKNSQRPGPGYPVPPRGAYYKPPMPKGCRDINGFFLFCLSALPGLNYMYIGLMKRGMFFMSLFFLICFIMGTLNAPMLIFALFMEMFYSFFDGFKIRRQILNGEHVNDDVDDVLGFYQNNKGLCYIVTALVVGSAIINKFLRIFIYAFDRVHEYYGFWAYDLISFAFAILVLAVGVVVIFKALNKRPTTRKDSTDINDHYTNK
ncbi:MAG: hypothetical protein LBU94_04530 [Clostridiales bacterium]|jgi:hypothetical protein|nr:hypothetical protein [Clostridiales bacterium]